ncbi:ABC transporter ATP-binding protein/permease [Methylophilaceae bacterium]|jgi:ATP-binding cassette, subfamily B, multidrug efflux pump|nr:ABC transporter ATP-binding protein/permease [Methylophilaceae bacterium]
MLQWFENLVSPFPKDLIKTPPKSLFKFAWLCIKDIKIYIGLMALLTAAIASFEAILYAVLGKIIDLMVTSDPSQFFNNHIDFLLLVGVILIGSTFFVAIRTMIKHQTLSGTFPMRMRWNFHRLLLNQSIDFYNNEFSGRIAAKVMQTTLALRDMWFILSDILVYVIVYITTMIILVGSLNTLLYFPFLIWLSIYIATLFYFIPKLAKLSKNQADARSLMTGRITDAYTNISTVKLFSHAGRESKYAKNAMKEFLHTVTLQMRKITAIQIINHFLSMLLILSTTGTALFLWSNNEIAIGVVAAAGAMSLRLNGISHWVMWEMTSLYEQIGVGQDGLNMLSKKQVINDRPNALSMNIKKAPILFKNVYFSYQKNDSFFSDFNLNIKHGEKVGIVGRSGAGKSSLVNLLLRFYELDKGEILIDNKNINSMTQDSLRSNIAMVTQDTSLLHRSIEENISYSKPSSSNKEIITAAKKAQAHKFIMELKDQYGNIGYKSLVGERGVKLSGGQKQRIAIARVILKNAPILLLDEATSSLDSEVEVIIQDSLDILMKGKTVIAIAHRLSTIAAMDRLIVMDNGQIIEEGNHKTLLKKKSLYYQLWQHQSGGFIGD